MKLPNFRALAFLACAFLVAATPAAAQESASAPVERLNTALLETMQSAKTLGYQGRYDQLAPELREVFDFATMARITLGRHWRDLKPPQQEAFTAAFGDFSIAVFADRFDGFSGERFEVLGEQPARRGAVLVRNQIVKSDGEAVPINYLARPGTDGDGWRLVDILLDAKYSELAARRSEYSGIVEREGIDALIAALKEKTAGYAAP
ncbi:hopanoid biosynthesis protein HpnM [Pelagibius litoralis]|uniref:Hopanoid biosynthesis protein HpnM n=1 Tax=Pelagibius litoralis TaxID=374515 RepID=A0A967EYP2_9PROT|nr:ABC transporter substrate-binding protein [Pelagibius litoralis]NIA69842.1 hopanoid biosynthesis protein HpnM [Pelagibius litoralis]